MGLLLQWGAHLLAILGTPIFNFRHKFKNQLILFMNGYNR
jgi:hypothetical protein